VAAEVGFVGGLAAVTGERRRGGKLEDPHQAPPSQPASRPASRYAACLPANDTRPPKPDHPPVW